MADVDLVKLSYFEFKDQPLEWILDDLQLGKINLIVGKNSTGKSRVLNVIGHLANQLLAKSISTSEMNYDAVFNTSEGELKYILRVQNGTVIKENLSLNGVEKLERDNKRLSLWYQERNAFIDHIPTATELSAGTRSDQLQHPYLGLLESWAKSVRSYHFGAELGKQHVAVVVKSAGVKSEFDDRDENRVVAIYMQAVKEFGDEFAAAVLADMKDLGYPLTKIVADTPVNFELQFDGNSVQLPGNVMALGVKEDGIGGVYFQHVMSQGMFRALSILVQVNYSQIAKRANCILIDDIGEGLDYDRSALLIEKLRKKAKESQFQLVMSTNDQFVMNHVPLDEWSVLQRNGNHVSVRNIHNSKAAFEDFQFVGMSNFTFFEMDFANAVREDGPYLDFDGGSEK